MADPGTKYTDKEIAKVENHLKEIYSEAAKDIEKKMDDFSDKYSIKAQIKSEQLKKGEITKEEYTSWMNGQIFQSDQWQSKVDYIKGMLTKTNEQAIKIVNGKTLDVFAVNANWESYKLEHNHNVMFGFGLVDSTTMTYLVKDYPTLLPTKKLDPVKDKAWNQKNITKQVTQGILQGESVEQVAKRMGKVVGRNYKSMLTNAQTALTGAQNAGRYYSLQRAKTMGIEVVKEWMATLDAHTRDTHRKIDGEQQKVGDMWHPMKFSNGCRYPGDPYGPPAEVYNCRCTLVGDLTNYPEKYKRYDNVDGKPISNMTYSEWEKVKKSTKVVPTLEDKLTQAQEALANFGNKTFKGIWKDDVTYADYEDKQYSIQAKKDYYNQQISKTVSKKDFIDTELDGDSDLYDFVAGFNSVNDLLNDADFMQKVKDGEFFLIDTTQDVKDLYTLVHANMKDVANASKFTQYLKDLDQFEKNGKVYSKLSDDVKQAQKELKDAQKAAAKGLGGSNQFAPDAWDASVKGKALSYTNKNLADNHYRKELDSMWDNLEDSQKYSVWEYTRNSNPINKSLSGYHDDWSRSSYLGPLNTDWGHEDRWRDVPYSGDFSVFGKNGGSNVDYHKAITNLTTAIDQTSFEDGTILVRGSDKNGLAGWIEGDLFSFDDAKKLLNGDEKTMKDALIGQEITNHAFTSTGVARGTGFSGEVMYSIYAPSGTRGIYAEPQSYFGNTSSSEIYKVGKSFRQVGGEAEVILQRGTTFRITDIEYDKNSSYGKINIKLEVVEQPDYFKFGDENTFDGGATRHMK